MSIYKLKFLPASVELAHFSLLVPQQAVKVFLGDHKIEALPISDDSDIIVRVDGKRVAVANNEPYLHKEGDESTPIFYVAFRDFYYTLHSEKYGLIIEYDGHSVHVQVSGNVYLS